MSVVHVSSKIDAKYGIASTCSDAIKDDTWIRVISLMQLIAYCHSEWGIIIWQTNCNIHVLPGVYTHIHSILYTFVLDTLNNVYIYIWQWIL